MCVGRYTDTVALADQKKMTKNMARSQLTTKKLDQFSAPHTPHNTNHTEPITAPPDHVFVPSSTTISLFKSLRCHSKQSPMHLFEPQEATSGEYGQIQCQN
jgi:hypothetical protein